MKAISAIFTALSLIIICSLAHASAVLVDAEGDVKVRQGKKQVAAKIGDELAAGARLDVGAGSRAAVLCESGSMDEVGPGQSYTVGEPSEAKSVSLGSGIAIAMKEIVAGGEGPAVHGMVKKVGGPRALKIDFEKLGGAGLTALYPSGTAVKLGPTIEFRWSEPIGKDWVKPSLALFDVAGGRVSVQGLKAGDTSLGVCPCDLKLKKGAEYKWFLAVTDGGLRSRTHEFKFTTLSDNEERRLASELSKVASLKISADGKALLDSQVYFGHGMYDETVRTLEPSYARSPSPFAKKLLHMCFMRMGRIDEAQKYK